MRSTIVVTTVVWLLPLAACPLRSAEVPSPLNGDANGDGRRDISDPIYVLNWLFTGGDEPVPFRCETGRPQGQNGDSNGDGRRDISDGIHLLSWLFGGGGAPVERLCEPEAIPTVRFAALGNTGKGNQGQFDVAAAIRQKCQASGCDFVVLLGNNIYDSGVDSANDSQWEMKFEAPYRDIDLDFYAILGNHDYGGNGAGYEFGKGQHQVDYTMVSTKWNMPAAYYHFIREHVELFGLDTNMQRYMMAEQQTADLAAWVAASSADWKIVIGHHSYLSNGPHGNAGNYDGIPFEGKGVKTFLDDIVCGRADLYLSANDLSLQWLEPTCAGTELVISGTGASNTSLSDRNTSRFQSLELGFLYVVVEGNTLTAEFVSVTGESLFTRTLSKQP